MIRADECGSGDDPVEFEVSMGGYPIRTRSSGAKAHPYPTPHRWSPKTTIPKTTVLAGSLHSASNFIPITNSYLWPLNITHSSTISGYLRSLVKSGNFFKNFWKSKRFSIPWSFISAEASVHFHFPIEEVLTMREHWFSCLLLISDSFSFHNWGPPSDFGTNRILYRFNHSTLVSLKRLKYCTFYLGNIESLCL